MSSITPLCLQCKGKGLCGKPCPLLARYNKYKTELLSLGENFNASGIAPFVGRVGYPDINLGLLSPPAIKEDAWMLDAPDFWYNQKYALDDIIDCRVQIINSRERNTNVANAQNPNKQLEVCQEIALSTNTPSVEVWLSKRPFVALQLDLSASLIGATGLVKKVKLEENAKIPKRTEKIVSDELKAAEQMTLLYKRGIDVNQLMRILSTGLLGDQKRKKLVPTRWAITATDDAIGKQLIKEIHNYRWINSYELYVNEYLGNKFYILLLPGVWQYELIEVWYGGSMWNPTASVSVSRDYESNYGRKTYAAETMGGYYASRLGALEYLAATRRQAACLIMREVSPAYSVPVGVWEVRENVRNAFFQKRAYDTLDDAIDDIKRQYKTSIDGLLATSKLLANYKQPSLKKWV